MLTWDIVLLKVRELANRTGMDFSEQIAELEEKYDQVCACPLTDYIYWIECEQELPHPGFVGILWK